MPEFSFVLGNPPDPEADVRQTLEFIRKVKRVNPSAEIILYIYTPVPLAGELYDQARANGFQFPETLEEWISPAWLDFSQRRNTHVSWVEDPLRRAASRFRARAQRLLSRRAPTRRLARPVALAAEGGKRLALPLAGLPVSRSSCGRCRRSSRTSDPRRADSSGMSTVASSNSARSPGASSPA